jgi:hypothetical protein
MELTKKVRTKKSTKTQCRRAKLKNKLIKNKGKKNTKPTCLTLIIIKKSLDAFGSGSLGSRLFFFFLKSGHVFCYCFF